MDVLDISCTCPTSGNQRGQSRDFVTRLKKCLYRRASGAEGLPWLVEAVVVSEYSGY